LLLKSTFLPYSTLFRSKNRVASSSKPAEQLYLSFFCLFHLAKVLKLISELLHRKKVNSQVSTVDKTAKISTSINPNLLKIELQVILNRQITLPKIFLPL